MQCSGVRIRIHPSCSRCLPVRMSVISFSASARTSYSGERNSSCVILHNQCPFVCLMSTIIASRSFCASAVEAERVFHAVDCLLSLGPARDRWHRTIMATTSYTPSVQRVLELVVLYRRHRAAERAAFQFGFAHKQNTRQTVKTQLPVRL